MPTTLHDREQAFEAKFARDEELRFLVTARRDKLFARWAASRLALPERETEALVRAVLAIPGGKGHDEAVLKHIAGVLSQRGDAASTSELSAALERCGDEARQQLLQAPPPGFEPT